jgi:hypothetical protein
MKFMMAFVFGWILNIWGFFDITANILGIVFWAFVMIDLLFLRDSHE